MDTTEASKGAAITWRTNMPDPARSEGARYERAAFRARLRRRIRGAWKEDEIRVGIAVLREELNWILERQQRYDKAPGGLGRTIRKR